LHRLLLAAQSADPAEYREAFALFDKRGTGQVPRESLGELLRSLGQNPTQADVAELERTVGATCEWNRACGGLLAG
jgi:Ca2+-binding EF-hand superfamily protein